MKKKSAPRPKLPAISEQMKAWCAALGGEIAGWPQVHTRVFFGFTALYRGEKIFAILPRTRAMGTPNTLAFKFDSVPRRLRARLNEDKRIGATQMQAARWQTFEMSSDSDLHDSLGWLSRAYEAAGKSKKVG
ncbi:MAG: hypothetical protein ACLP72_18215 [Candidatus Sulfotelmatobacter sp.]